MELLKFDPKPKEQEEKIWADPTEFLTDFLAHIKEGKIKPESIYIMYVDKLEDGTREPHYWSIGNSFFERIALLEFAKFKEISEAKGE